MGKAIRYAAMAIVIFHNCTGSQSPKLYYNRIETNFSTSIKSLEEQNNNSLKNAISLLIMSKNGEIPFSLVEKISRSIIVNSIKYDFDPLFITSVIYKESEYDPFATSSKGAVGLMQLMPRYFEDSNENIYDIDVNIEKGTAELYRLREKYCNYSDMLMAYLGGEHIVRKYKRGEVSEETAILLNYYANIILLNYQILSSRFRVNQNHETEILSMY